MTWSSAMHVLYRQGVYAGMKIHNYTIASQLNSSGGPVTMSSRAGRLLLRVSWVIAWLAYFIRMPADVPVTMSRDYNLGEGFIHALDFRTFHFNIDTLQDPHIIPFSLLKGKCGVGCTGGCGMHGWLRMTALLADQSLGTLKVRGYSLLINYS